MQFAHTIAMVRPAAFGFNEETAANNFFQDCNQKNNVQLQQLALQQFDAMVLLLRSHDIDVLVLQDTATPEKPDAIYPNNWFSCHDKAITIFPMFAQNRRTEKRQQLIAELKFKTGIAVVNDWSAFEEKQRFLEGTGSMVIDHERRKIYACSSVRTDKNLLESFCKKNNYTPISFSAADENGNEIYHTNVMFCMGNHFAVICLEAIKNELEKINIMHDLQTDRHEIVAISFAQMSNFAGNMLQLQNKKGEYILVMSSTAFDSLTSNQICTLKKYTAIVTPDVSYIENAGGGSVRCMMAELFY